MEQLCFVLPKIEPHDFERYRDGQTSIRRLRNKILGIPDNFIPSMREINNRVQEYKREMERLKNARLWKTTNDPLIDIRIDTEENKKETIE